MSRTNRARSSGLFLLELIVAILFFALASAICVQIFVKAHFLSRDAAMLQTAVHQCAGIAELITVSQDSDVMVQTLLSLYPDTQHQPDGSIQIYFDSEMCPSTAEKGAYLLTLQPNEQEHMLTVDLQMNRLSDNSSLYTQQILHHIPREVSFENATN